MRPSDITKHTSDPTHPPVILGVAGGYTVLKLKKETIKQRGQEHYSSQCCELTLEDPAATENVPPQVTSAITVAHGQSWTAVLIILYCSHLNTVTSDNEDIWSV